MDEAKNTGIAKATTRLYNKAHQKIEKTACRLIFAALLKSYTLPFLFYLLFLEESQYSIREEKLNVQSHAFGFLLSILALIVLVLKSYALQQPTVLFSAIVFGSSFIILYAASTLYHQSTNAITRRKLRILDHAAIYVLIAGTYTPFVIVTLQYWAFLWFIWGFALAGIVLKIFFTGRFDAFSTIMYVIMGWIGVIAIKPLMEHLPLPGLWWLLGGGILYTVGAVFYSFKKLPYNHFIFHLLVLMGSICHFISVYFYVL